MEGEKKVREDGVMMKKGLPIFSREEVAVHNTDESAWIIIGDGVYEVTEFMKRHPAGASIIEGCTGGDATLCYKRVFHSPRANKILDSIRIGYVLDQ